jgi:hypothetical protein
MVSRRDDKRKGASGLGQPLTKGVEKRWGRSCFWLRPAPFLNLSLKQMQDPGYQLQLASSPQQIRYVSYLRRGAAERQIYAWVTLPGGSPLSLVMK